MVTPKIVKLYFSFVMTIVAASALSYFPVANETMKAALVFFDVEMEEVNNSGVFDFSQHVQASVHNLDVVSENPFELFFDFEHEPSMAYARRGEEDKEVMQIVFESSDAPVTLSNLKLKVSSVDIDKIDSAKLIAGEKVLSTGVKSNDYFNFANIDLKLEEGEEGRVSLVVNLSTDLRPHDIVRFDLEKNQDLGLKLGGLPYKVKGYYPLKGEPLFIVK